MPLSRSEQSRINGAKSRGPSTPEGKRISSGNALQHGLRAEKVVVLQNERPDAFDQLHAAFVEKFNPRDNAERELVLQAVAARWRLRRIWQLETCLFDLEMDRQRDQITKTFTKYDEGTRQAVAFESLVTQRGTFHALSRYEARISREYDRAIRALYLARDERANPPAHEPARLPEEARETAVPLASNAAANVPNEPEPAPAALANSVGHTQKINNSPVFSLQVPKIDRNSPDGDATTESACHLGLHIAPSPNSQPSPRGKP